MKKVGLASVQSLMELVIQCPCFEAIHQDEFDGGFELHVNIIYTCEEIYFVFPTVFALIR